jgi:tetratricopeptide (TPR) repeat protein
MKLYKDKVLLGFALGAGLFSLIVYYLTKAPTLSFWDCGEFIACADILGIPHPPGYPLFTLIGRFVILLPLPFTSAVKVNIVSVVSSAAAVFVAYWLIIRMVVGFEKEITTLWQRLGLAVGAFSGSLILAFSSTFWDNAIEAECYGLAMMLALILSYLLLLWSNKIGKPGAGKLMVAIAYLAFLSIGIHLTTFLIMPFFVIYMAVKDPKLLSDWRYWVTWVILLMVIGQLDIFLYGTAIIFVVSMVMLIGTKNSAYMTKLIFAISFAAIIGYSTHLYLPIRAHESPEINENNPDDWDRLKSLLERKQYGQESMITRMFDRRGSWAHQFGVYPHMGFWGYFREQYSKLWAAFIYFALGIWGIYESYRRNKLNGLWLLALFLASTVGLVLYLNFSDGTRGAILEVRNRDYFFTPGFMFFGVLIGIGMSGLLYDFADWIKNRPLRKYLMIAAMAFCILLPINTLQANYFEHDRSRNYIPWDYAFNILSSIDQNGILFTNGDNDTFPLWYIQEVEHFRKDVRVVNLSLLNTPWYIHQLKDQMGVPVSYSYDQIENLRPLWDPDKERVWRVQDEMVRDIITTNKWREPIFFAVTVSADNRLGLDDNLVMEGMGYRLVPSKGKNRVDPEKMWQYYMDTFKFRSLEDPTIYKSENDTRLVANYVSGFLQLADTLKQEGDLNKAIEVVKRSIEIYPNDWRHRAYLGGLYSLAGMVDSLGTILEGVGPEDAVKICINAAQEALYSQKKEEARDLLKLALQYNPKSITAFNNLVYLEDELGDSAAVDSLTSSWRLNNAGDTEAQNNLDNLLNALQARHRSKDTTQKK